MRNFSLTSTGRTGLLRLLGTIITLGLLIYLLSQQGWETIWLAIQQIHWSRLVLAFVIMMISRLAVTARWYILLHSGELNITFGKTLEITFAGLFATNFLPTTIGGDVVRLAGAIQSNLNATISAASLIADRLIGLVGMVMAVPFGIPSIIHYSATIGVLPVSPFPQLLSLAPIPIQKWWQKVWTKGADILRRLVATLSLWLKQPVALAKSLAYSWVHMICLFSILSILFVSMGEEVSFFQVGGLYSVVYLVTLLPISINGYGLQEISMTFVFSEIAGVSFASAVAVALLFRTLMMLASLPGALFLPGVLTGTRRSSAD